MDDFFDDNDGMDDGFDDDWKDEPTFGNESAESDEDHWDGPEWQDWMIIGPLSEDIAREKRDIERTRREWDDECDNYWDMIKRKW